MPAEDARLVARLRARGRDADRQDERARVRHGLAHVQQRLRHDASIRTTRRKSAGGSSGGAAAALAAGMLPIADGSDLGGSLRNPANFNNIVGLRPTVGLVPPAPDALPFLGSVKGPMARTVDDVAFLLGVMAGPDPRDPSCYPSIRRFAAPLERDFRGVRVAWCPDLGGFRSIRACATCWTPARDVRGSRLHRRRCAPDLTGADDVFLTIRASAAPATSGRCSTSTAIR